MKRFGMGAIAPAVLAASLLGASAEVRSQASEAAPDGADAQQVEPPAGEDRRRGPRGPTPLGDGPREFDTEEGRIRVTVVSKDLERPWGLAFLPDGGMLVTERPGRLRVFRDGELDPTPIGGLPAIRAVIIGGLLDIVLHPRFEENRLIYFAYSKPDPDEPTLATTAVGRARWDGGSMLADVEDVFVADAWYSSSMSATNDRCCGQGPADGSYGSRIVFDAEGYLFVTLGDRNWGEMAQNPASHLGKIVRIHDDGTVPDDNPFIGREGYLPDIYTLGHRNPLGLAFHPETGELWSTEFGPRGGDELNLIVAGINYGWILVTEGKHYNGDPRELGTNSVPGMVDPVLFWAPSINPGNLIFYGGDAFPAWQSDMLMASMSRTLLRASFDDAGNPLGQERMLTELGQRFRDVRQGPDGLVYVLTDEQAGAMLKIEPVP